jgi:hypothetical protein
VQPFPTLLSPGRGAAHSAARLCGNAREPARRRGRQGRPSRLPGGGATRALRRPGHSGRLRRAGYHQAAQDVGDGQSWCRRLPRRLGGGRQLMPLSPAFAGRAVRVSPLAAACPRRRPPAARARPGVRAAYVNAFFYARCQERVRGCRHLPFQARPSPRESPLDCGAIGDRAAPSGGNDANNSQRCEAPDLVCTSYSAHRLRLLPDMRCALARCSLPPSPAGCALHPRTVLTASVFCRI